MANDQVVASVGKQRAGNRADGENGPLASVKPAEFIGLDELKAALLAVETPDIRIVEVFANITPAPNNGNLPASIHLKYAHPFLRAADVSPYAVTADGVKINI